MSICAHCGRSIMDGKRYCKSCTTAVYHAKGKKVVDAYIPTPEEIAAKTAEIRATWTEYDYYIRAGWIPASYYELPTVPTGDGRVRRVVSGSQ